MEIGPSENDLNSEIDAKLDKFRNEVEEKYPLVVVEEPEENSNVEEKLRYLALFTNVPFPVIMSNYNKMGKNGKIACADFITETVEEINIVKESIVELKQDIEIQEKERTDLRKANMERAKLDEKESTEYIKTQNAINALATFTSSLREKYKTYISDFRSLKVSTIQEMMENGLLQPNDFDINDEEKSEEIIDRVVTVEEPENEESEKGYDTFARFPTPKGRDNNQFLKILSDISGKKEKFGFHEVVDFTKSDWVTYISSISSTYPNQRDTSVLCRLTLGLRLSELMKSLTGESLDELYEAYHLSLRTNDQKRAISEWLFRFDILTSSEYEKYLKEHRLT